MSIKVLTNKYTNVYMWNSYKSFVSNFEFSAGVGHPQLLLVPATTGLIYIALAHALEFLWNASTHIWRWSGAFFGFWAPDAAIGNFSKPCMEHFRFWVHTGISMHIQWSLHLPWTMGFLGADRSFSKMHIYTWSVAVAASHRSWIETFGLVPKWSRSTKVSVVNNYYKGCSSVKR